MGSCKIYFPNGDLTAFRAMAFRLAGEGFLALDRPPLRPPMLPRERRGRTSAELNAVSGRRILVTEGMEIDANDPAYEQDVHIVPRYFDGQEYRFGVHELERTCHCHPEIQAKANGRTLVLHSERVT